MALLSDFVTNEPRTYRVRLGKLVASALSGFVVGVIVASILWMVAFYYINTFVLTDSNGAPPPIPFVER